MVLTRKYSETKISIPETPDVLQKKLFKFYENEYRELKQTEYFNITRKKIVELNIIIDWNTLNDFNKMQKKC